MEVEVASVYRRYRIVNEDDMRVALERVQHAIRVPASPKVTAARQG